jgi:flagellum-specific peptidoglycan hydrolase FlgJ
VQVTPTPEQKNAFIASVVPAAQSAMRMWRVPASITIAQAILESGWGQSALAIQAKNFFGIKFNQHLEGDGYIQFPTREVVGDASETVLAEFEKYNSVEQSFDAHGRLLATSSRYAAAMEEADDPFVFAAQLYKTKYSTDPAYPSELCKIITQFRLTQYDQAASQSS